MSAITLLMLLFVVPVGLSALNRGLGDATAQSWRDARRDSSQQAPDPATTPEAVVQVYAARAYGWRGALGVHTWVAVKPEGAPTYTRLEVMGWGVRRGYDAVRIRQGVADAYWYGNRPWVLSELRGEAAAVAIGQIFEAARSYPHPREYRLWPGPNSNTFTAHVGRAVPALRLDLPPNAVGKDYIPGGGLVAAAPSGTGGQLSVLGLLGVLVAIEEGLELNLLGLTVGVDVARPALKLPGLGRIGVD